MLWPTARIDHTTLSSCEHECSGQSHALVTTTFSSCGHGCSGHSRAGHTDVIIVRTWMLWPFARTGHTDVIIVWTWILWPFACWPHDATVSSCRHGCFGRSHALVTHYNITDVLQISSCVQCPYCKNEKRILLILEKRT